MVYEEIGLGKELGLKLFTRASRAFVSLESYPPTDVCIRLWSQEWL